MSRARCRRAAVVVAAGLWASACSSSPQPLAEDHPAAVIASEVDNAEDFGEEAGRRGLPWICASGGSPDWELCILHAGGVTGLVAFGATQGLTAVVTGTGLEAGVVVDLAGPGWFGVRRTEGSIAISVQLGGREIGSFYSDVFPRP
ncbi:MAG TPA: hypothetical protein VJR05_05315 [Acidimicrobiia bacterium]|nr:hypothetical protein [Acidimicrobiia bacterium]